MYKFVKLVSEYKDHESKLYSIVAVENSAATVAPAYPLELRDEESINVHARKENLSLKLLLIDDWATDQFVFILLA